MNNDLFKILRDNERDSIRINMYDVNTQGISSWFMNEYRIRSDDEKFVVCGKDEDISYHWIELASNSMITDFEQDKIFNVIILRFTYKDRYLVEMRINTLEKENRSLKEDSYSHTFINKLKQNK